MDSFTGTMVSHHIKIPSRYRTRTMAFHTEPDGLTWLSTRTITSNSVILYDQNHGLFHTEPSQIPSRYMSRTMTRIPSRYTTPAAHDMGQYQGGAVSGWVRQRHGCLSSKGASTARVQYRGINPYYGLQQNGSYLHHLLDMAPIKCFHITLQLAISDCMLWPSDVLHLFRALEDQMLLSWRITRQFWICHFFEIVRNSSPERPVSIPRSIWWFTKFQSVSQQLSI